MKTLNFLLTIMFLGFSALQINDPDPVVWILIYGSMAAVCMMAAFEYYLRWLMLVQAIIYIAYAYTLLPSIRIWLALPDRLTLFDDLATMKYLYIEESREFFGLMICLVVLGVYGYRSRKK